MELGATRDLTLPDLGYVLLKSPPHCHTRLSAKAPSCGTNADLPSHHLLEAIGFQWILAVAEKEVHYKRLLSSVGKLDFPSE